jgi:hypothetical protein
MDANRFDRLTRSLAATAPRRGLFAALLGAGLAGVVGAADARKNRRGQRRRNGRVAAHAVNCGKLASGQDVSGCDYTGEDHSGEDLSSAKMIKTVFRDATLVETNLHSANMKSATFRGAKLQRATLASGVLEGASLREANLCGANLRSAVVRHATFRDANLTKADLKSATGCNRATFTAGTTFCATRMCDGRIRNDDCPDGPPPDSCCIDAECSAGVCRGGRCCDVCLDGCPFSSLADAVADADANDTIRLCPGRYPTRDVEIGIDLTIVGAGAGSTVLDAAGPTPAEVFSISAGASVRIEALTAAGGSFQNTNRGTLTLRDVVLTDNGLNNFGTLTLESGTLVQHGISSGIVNEGMLTLKNGSRIEGNGAHRGGGILNNGGTATLEAGSRVTRNFAISAGGGIYEDGGAVLVADEDIVTGNFDNNCRPVGAMPNCVD